MKRRLVFAAAFCAGLAAQAVSVSNVRFAYDATLHHATITYDLADGPAIVTLDILTNATVAAEGASIGGANVRSVFGDVNKVVPSGQNHVITWKTDAPAAFAGPVSGLRPVVNAWTLTAPPEVMVIDLSHKIDGTTYELFYYPSLDALPGGITDNMEYKTTKLVMKHIHAPVGGKWMMGSFGEFNAGSNEVQHEVSLTDDYWMGVFELTQYQTYLIKGGWPNASNGQGAYFKTVDGGVYGMRPLEYCCFNFMRSTVPPEAPGATTVFGYLRSRTGYAFDLPGEMQWEYAARCGNPPGMWGDGSAMAFNSSSSASSAAEDDPAADRLSRNIFTGGATGDPALGAHQGTAIVGSYAPNKWGLYDMHGNVKEMCLDYYVADITELDGAIQKNPGTPAGSDAHVIRGGCYWDYHHNMRPCKRLSKVRNSNDKTIGCRLYAPIAPTVME
jgi:formylglycine-generating enzyme required for sulfatase activity